jgi:uncharacterized heparinase superfamily protein
MYHTLFLVDLIDIQNLLNASSGTVLSNSYINVDNIQSKIVINATKMLDWLFYMRYPENEIPLFNDTSLGITPSYKRVKNYYDKIRTLNFKKTEDFRIKALKNSGYYIMKSDSQRFIIDCGKLGVDYQPGHSHCDILSYEYSCNEKRFIIDCGVGSYSDVPLRMKARSIYSHNTVIVNEQEQGEIWKIFRMGKRVKKIQASLTESNQTPQFEGFYINNIHSRQKYWHKRTVNFIRQSFFLIQDEIFGNNIKKIESLIHISPDCHIERNPGELILSINNTTIFILFNTSELNMKIKDWIYTPEFGKILNSNLIILKPNVADLRTFKYIIVPGEYRYTLDISKIF